MLDDYTTTEKATVQQSKPVTLISRVHKLEESSKEMLETILRLQEENRQLTSMLQKVCEHVGF